MLQFSRTHNLSESIFPSSFQTSSFDTTVRWCIVINRSIGSCLLDQPANDPLIRSTVIYSSVWFDSNHREREYLMKFQRIGKWTETVEDTTRLFVESLYRGTTSPRKTCTRIPVASWSLYDRYNSRHVNILRFSMKNGIETRKRGVRFIRKYDCKYDYREMFGRRSKFLDDRSFVWYFLKYFQNSFEYFFTINLW